MARAKGHQRRRLSRGEAWQRCRAGREDPDRFGIFDMHGLGFVAGRLVRDLLALNKLEILPWDGWGLMRGPGGELRREDRCGSSPAWLAQHLQSLRSGHGQAEREGAAHPLLALHPD